jgi:hypothetical protein
VAKLGDFKTPTGQSGNIMSISSWMQGILGAMFFIIAFAIGQSVTAKLGGKVPYVDTTIDKPWKDPVLTTVRNVEVL